MYIQEGSFLKLNIVILWLYIYKKKFILPKKKSLGLIIGLILKNIEDVYIIANH